MVNGSNKLSQRCMLSGRYSSISFIPIVLPFKKNFFSMLCAGNIFSAHKGE